MVTLKEVPDEHFEDRVAEVEEDEEFTDTDSEISNESNFDPSHETLWDRLFALRMIIPPSTRHRIGLRASTGYRFCRTAVVFGLRAGWVVCATAMLFGIPFALAYHEEQQVMAMDEEQRMREQGNDLLTAGVGAGGDDTTKAAQLGAILGESAEGSRGGKTTAQPAL